MSGGMGTRLRPLTCQLPKPMVPIFNKPVMEYGIEILKEYGIEDIAVTLYYLPNNIMEYFNDGKEFDVNIKYYIENEPLGTGGSVKNAQEFLDNTFIVISGDAFTNINITKAYEFHREKGSKATLVLKKEPIPLEYGVVITDEYGRIIRFLEKPNWGEVFSDTINTGIYILEPEVLDYYKKGDNFDFSKDLFPRLLKDDIPMYGYITEEYWCDVGDISTYVKTHEDIFLNFSKDYLLEEELYKGIWAEEGVTIEKGARLYPPIYIGKNSLIKEGAIVEPYTVIGNNCVIKKGTSIKRSILWDNVIVEENCEIRKSVICNKVHIDKRSRLFEGAVIGANVKIDEDVTIKPDVKIWPYKTIDENVIVRDNLIWGKGSNKKLFGYRNISGVFNQNITPEMAVSLGTAFATVMGAKGSYILSSDEHNLSKSIKSSLISGLLSMGSQVIDIDNISIPICRFGIKYFNAQGGIHISSYGVDEVYIEFMDERGANIDNNSKQKIENSILIGDFNRCFGDEIKGVVNIYNFAEIYIKEGKSYLKNIDKIKSKNPRIIISSPSENISELAKECLMGIGCNIKKIPYEDGWTIEDISKRVLDEDGDLGVLFSKNGEGIALTDGFNNIKDEKYHLLTLSLGFKTGELKEAVIPYNFPRIVEKVAQQYGGKINYSKSNISNIIGTILDRNIEAQYILNFDGIWAIGKIVDYLVGENIALNTLVQELPEYFYLKKEIPCEWDDKGNILRRLTEERQYGIELVEGVRFIEDKGWVMILPDEEKPTFNLYVEGYKEEYAEELCTIYNEKIKKMIKDL